MEQLLQKYQTVLEKDPQNLDALRALATCYEEMGRQQDLLKTFKTLENIFNHQKQWNDLAKTLENHQQILSDDKERSDLLCKLGELYFKKLGNKYQAIDCYVKALELDYEKSYLLDQLGEIYEEKNEKFSDVIEFFKNEAGKEGAPEKRILNWLEIADIYLKVLSQPENALPYYKKVLDKDPCNHIAFDALENFNIEKGDWVPLIKLYEDMIPRFQKENLPQSESEIISLYFKMATIYRDKLLKPFEAMETYERIKFLAPNNLQVRTLLDQLRSHSSTWEQIGEGFLKEANISTTQKSKIPPLKKAAKVFFNYLSQKEKGIEIYLDLLKQNPADQEAEKIVRNYFTEKNKWEDLIKIYERMTENTKDPILQNRLFNAMGSLFQHKLKTNSLAIHSYERGLKNMPNQDETLQALEGLYQEDHNWPQLAGVLKALLKSPKSMDHRISLLSKLGRINAKHLDEKEQAIKTYQEIIDLDPNHVESLNALETIYQEKRNWEGLQYVYANLLNVAQSQSRQLDILKKYATLLNNRFHKPEQAVEILIRARDQSPQDIQVTLDLEQIYSDLKDWTKLVALYEEEALKTRSTEMHGLWHQKAGKIHERYLGNKIKAIDSYQKALEQDPKNLKIIRAIENLYEKVKDWEKLLQTYKKELVFYENDSPAAIPLLLRIAETIEHRQGNLQDSISYYRKVLALDKDNYIALKALERLFLRTEDWQNLLETFYSQLNLFKDLEEEEKKKNSLHVYHRIAALYAEHLPNPIEAIQINEKVLQLNSGDKEALENLKLLYQTRQKWVELVNTLEREIRTTTDPQEKAKLNKEIATILSEKLGDERMALDYLQKSYDLHPENPSILMALGNGYEKIQAWEPLIQLFQKELQRTEKEDHRLLILERLAWVQRKDEKKQEEAIKSYQEILKIDPEHPSTLHSLEEIYTELEKWEPLRDLLLSTLPQLKENDAKVHLHLSLGDLFENRFSQFENSLDHYRLALEYSKNNLDAISAIRRILKKTNNWGEYLRYTKQALDLTENREMKANLFFEMAKIWKNEFHQNQQAIQFLQNSLQIKPSNLECLNALWKNYLEEEAWKQAIEVGQKILHLSHDSLTQIQYRLQMARIFHKTLNDLSNAAATYQEVLSFDPKNSTILEEFKTLQVERKKWKSVIDLSYQQLDLTKEKATKVDLFSEITKIWQDHLGSRSNAERTLKEILRLEPLHEETLNQLGELIPDSSLWKEIQKKVLEALDQENLKEKKVNALKILAQYWDERFLCLEPAMDCLRMAQELDPENPIILERLGQTLLRLGYWKDFLQVSEKEIQQFKISFNKNEEKEKTLDRLLSCAQVSSKSLKDTSSAIAFLNRAQKGFGKNEKIFEGLEPLLFEEKEWKPLLKVYEEWLSIKSSNSEKVVLYLKMAELYRSSLEDPEQAEAFFKKVLESDSQNLVALEGLAELKKKEEKWKEAIEFQKILVQVLGFGPKAAGLNLEIAAICQNYLEDLDGVEKVSLQTLEMDTRNLQALHYLQWVYKKRKSRKELLRTYQKEATLYIEEDREVFLNQAMADLWENHFHEIPKAAQCYRRILDLDPKNEQQWIKAHEFFKRNKLWNDLGEILQRKIEGFKNKEVDLISLHFQLACLLMDHLGELDQAVRYFEQTLRLKPDHLDAFDRLIKIHTQSGKSEALVDTLDRKASILEDPIKIVKTLHQIADLWEKDLKNQANAEEVFLRILRFDHKNKRALDHLRMIYKKSLRWDAYAKVLEDLLGHTNKAEKKAEIHEELGEIFYKNLKNQERAMDHFEAVLSLSPTHAKAISALESIYENQGKWQPYVDVLNKKYKATTSPQKQAHISKKQAEIYLKHLHQTDKALQHYERALQKFNNAKNRDVEEIQMETLGLQKMLRNLYRKTTSWDKLIKTLNQILDGPKTKENKHAQVDLLLERAEIEEKHLKNKANAAQTLRDLLLLLPSHKKAIETLVSLLNKEKHFDEIILYKKKILELEKIPKRKAALHFSFSEFLDAHPKDQKFHLKKALELDPENALALRKIRMEAISKKQWPNAINSLEIEKKIVEEKLQKLEVLLQLARIYFEKLQKETKAIRHFEEALELDPQNYIAVSLLGKIHFENENWDKAEFYYIQLSIKAGIRPVKPEEIKSDQLNRKDFPIKILTDDEIFFRLGSIALHLGRSEDAMMHFQQAIKANPKNHQAMQSLADLFYNQKQWKNSAPIYEKILKAFSERSSTKASNLKEKEQIPSLHHRLGMIHFHLANQHNPTFTDPAKIKHHQEEAKRHLLKVLESDASHTQALLSLIDLELKREKWADAITYLDQIREISKDELYVLESYCRKGELYFKKLKKTDKAIASFQEALNRDPEFEPALRGLANIYQAKKEWPEAIKILNHLEEICSDSNDLANFYFQEGQIYSREIGDLDQASQLLEKALEKVPHHAQSLQEIAQIHRKREHWDKLLDHLKYTLKVLPTAESENIQEIQLEMGSIYLYHLQNFEEAEEVFKNVLKTSPKNLDAHLALARLYTKNERAQEQAVQEYREILQEDIGQIEALKELITLLKKQRKTDQVFTLSSILEFIDPNPALEQDIEKFKQMARNRFENHATEWLNPDENLKYLVHPMEQGLLRKILGQIAPILHKVMLPWEGFPQQKSHGYQPSMQTDILLRMIAKFIHCKDLKIEVHEDVFPKHVLFWPSAPNKMFVNRDYHGLEQEHIQYFLAGRSFYYLISGTIPALYFSPIKLRRFYVALGRHFHPNLDLSLDPSEEFNTLYRNFKKALSRSLKKDLKDNLSQFSELFDRMDFKTWIQVTQHSANRLGLLICQEPYLALQALSQETQEDQDSIIHNLDSADSHARIRWLKKNPQASELIKYALSSNYTDLRRRLGLSLPAY